MVPMTTVNETVEVDIPSPWRIVTIEVVPPFGQKPAYFACHCQRDSRKR
jgi:hypothetical protein